METYRSLGKLCTRRCTSRPALGISIGSPISGGVRSKHRFEHHIRWHTLEFTKRHIEPCLLKTKDLRLKTWIKERKPYVRFSAIVYKSRVAFAGIAHPWVKKISNIACRVLERRIIRQPPKSTKKLVKAHTGPADCSTKTTSTTRTKPKRIRPRLEYEYEV